MKKNLVKDLMLEIADNYYALAERSDARYAARNTRYADACADAARYLGDVIEPIPGPEGQLCCGQCGLEINRSWIYCPNCGSQIKKI